METWYEVSYGNTVVGKVEIQPQGLYCRVLCRCQIPGDQVIRLFAQAESHRENLGVLVPDGDGFLLDKKIPVKRLGWGTLRFYLSATGTVGESRFVPICPEEPFLYIHRLKTAFLESECGKIGIRIQNHPEAV